MSPRESREPELWWVLMLTLTEFSSLTLYLFLELSWLEDSREKADLFTDEYIVYRILFRWYHRWGLSINTAWAADRCQSVQGIALYHTSSFYFHMKCPVSIGDWRHCKNNTIWLLVADTSGTCQKQGGEGGGGELYTYVVGEETKSQRSPWHIEQLPGAVWL